MRIYVPHKRRGASLVEFAFVAPVFFMFLFGIIEFSRLLFVAELVNNAAREGARFAAVNTTEVTTAEIQQYVDRFMAGQGTSHFVNYSPSNNITVFKADPTTGANLGENWQNAAWGDGIGVTVTGTYRPLVPGLTQLASVMTIRGTCIITSEAN